MCFGTKKPPGQYTYASPSRPASRASVRQSTSSPPTALAPNPTPPVPTQSSPTGNESSTMNNNSLISSSRPPRKEGFPPPYSQANPSQTDHTSDPIPADVFPAAPRRQNTSDLPIPVVTRQDTGELPIPVSSEFQQPFVLNSDPIPVSQPSSDPNDLPIPVNSPTPNTDPASLPIPVRTSPHRQQSESSLPIPVTTPPSPRPSSAHSGADSSSHAAKKKSWFGHHHSHHSHHKETTSPPPQQKENRHNPYLHSKPAMPSPANANTPIGPFEAEQAYSSGYSDAVDGRPAMQPWGLLGEHYARGYHVGWEVKAGTNSFVNAEQQRMRGAPPPGMDGREQRRKALEPGVPTMSEGLRNSVGAQAWGRDGSGQIPGSAQQGSGRRKGWASYW